MPTPFYHLSIAEELLAGGALPAQARTLIERNRPAFLLGHTAPDVAAVFGQERAATHFFEVPLLAGQPPAWEKMLSAHPSLRFAMRLPEAQAAFIAGYLCHLQADVLWVQRIYEPVFGPAAAWDSFGRRQIIHNVLRSYMDARLPDGFARRIHLTLMQAAPYNWLPFVNDHYLTRWRDFLTGQLAPGSVIQTVEVFAERQGVPPEFYYRLIGSEALMDAEVFSRLPRLELADYRGGLVNENLRLLSAYLA
jgi:hypothetical protein